MEKKEPQSLRSMVVETKECLLGTYNKKGLVSKVEDNTKGIEENRDYIDKQRKTKNSRFEWAYKCFTSILLSYIAVRAGMR